MVLGHFATHRYAEVDATTINRQKMVNFIVLVLDRLVILNCDKERFLGSSFSCCLRALVKLAGERHRLYKWNFLQRNERFRPLAQVQGLSLENKTETFVIYDRYDYEWTFLKTFLTATRFYVMCIYFCDKSTSTNYQDGCWLVEFRNFGHFWCEK